MKQRIAATDYIEARNYIVNQCEQHKRELYENGWDADQRFYQAALGASDMYTILTGKAVVIEPSGDCSFNEE